MSKSVSPFTKRKVSASAGAALAIAPAVPAGACSTAIRIVATAPIKLGNRFASRLKVMSGLDIAERRIPQDGRIKLNITKTRAIDFRVSTLPTLFGEKIVLRILDGSSAKLGIDKLGYEEAQKKLYLDAIEKLKPINQQRRNDQRGVRILK